ncbi:MAG: thymidine phosphorylase [Candidatus Eremiobacteraeota bacterium]|nr:thymidine phosphorylase [Candidatus Eremiobacteraeota bacterium]
MKPYDIIKKKKEGGCLSCSEIESMIQGFSKGDIPDYLMSAFLMAVCLKGMDDAETKDLTQAMTDSGHKVNLASIPGRKVDKHSTGGVGDTTTLLIGPIISAAGIPFAKMSGRGLAHTGGTLDKLESIPGFRTGLTEEEFISQVKEIGIALISPTGDLAPADKKMYALRDVTATVDSIPLIAGSIMSKKLAAGADVILLDVKVGSGAFMTTLDDARALARALVNIGTLAGKHTRAVITDMNQPLNSHIGNALEVKEVIEILKGGRRDSPLREVALELSAHLLQMAGVDSTLEEARSHAADLLQRGAALEKMRQVIKAQGGKDAVLDDTSLLPRARVIRDIPAQKEGYLGAIEVMKMGIIARDLGAGRVRKEDSIDPSVGLVIHRRIGDKITSGESIVTVHGASEKSIEEVRESLLECFIVLDQPVEAPPLILATIGS